MYLFFVGVASCDALQAISFRCTVVVVGDGRDRSDDDVVSVAEPILGVRTLLRPVVVVTAQEEACLESRGGPRTGGQSVATCERNNTSAMRFVT